MRTYVCVSGGGLEQSNFNDQSIEGNINIPKITVQIQKPTKC